MRTSLKKHLILLIIFSMVMALAVGCAPKAEGPSDEPATTDEEPAETPEPSDDEGEAAEEPDVADLEPYELTYFMLCNNVSPDADQIVERANEILKEKINATLDLVMLDWGTWSERFNTAMNAGEKIDIAFTADWWGYLDAVANNFFLPLNDPDDNLLEKYAAQTVKDLGEGFIVGSQINGVNYGVPTDKEFAVNGGLVWRKDLAEKYGFDMQSVNSIEDLEPMLKVIKENEPDIIPYLVERGGGFYMIPFIDFFKGVGVSYDDLEDTEVKWTWDREDRIQMAKTHHKYYKEGYIHKEAYTENNRYNDHLLEGDFFVTQQPLKPMKGKSTELMSAAGNKFPLDEKEITPYVAHSLHAAGSMLAIPRTSEDPARAMMFINLMHVDAELANLFVWGIEGVHHKVVQEDPKRVAPIEGNTWTQAVLPWTLGNVFNHWLGEHEDPNKHEGFRMTKEAPAHITLGYRFINTQDYQAEAAAYDNAMSEYSSIIATGAVENFDETYQKMVEAAEAAGIRKIQEAVQADLNRWLEEQGKK